MPPNETQDLRDPAFLRELERINAKKGRKVLTDEELLFLACEEISRTRTREEIGYSN
jgi:hypothetical protein